MSAADLLAAFNGAAFPNFEATNATLGYERAGGTEFTRLTFSGHSHDGAEFTQRSELLRPGVDVNTEAKNVALALLAKQKPKP